MAKRDKNVGKKQSKSAITSRKSTTSVNIKFDKKLSLVIPCYNETNRVQYLASALKAFDSSWYNNYEVIVVDDGSTDGTADKVSKMLSEGLAKAERVEVIRLEKNQGKGAALQAGVEQATGDFILTLDADMASKPTLLKRWLQLLPNNEFRNDQILIGSREHKNSEIEAKSDRKTLGRVFNVLTQFTTSLDLQDTQCGFKLYPAEIAKSLFANLSSKGWSHDVEILYKAKLNNIEIESMPVKWQHVDGEKSMSAAME
ncbi:MAG: glycosyltransferase [Saprospiraceae bacterium]|nr:glycosyltransferase [Saprospiraceae bacterium]